MIAIWTGCGSSHGVYTVVLHHLNPVALEGFVL
jgi:hypothetical protein